MTKRRRRRVWLAAGYGVVLPVLLAVGGVDYLQLLTGIGLPERSGPPMHIIAHRGDVERYPENTLAGIEAAAGLGVDGIEFDVHASADGTWWVMHDPTLDETTNGSGAIAELRDEEIEAAEIDSGAGFVPDRHAGMGVPRLTEIVDALARFDGVVIVDLQHAAAGPLSDLVALLPPRSMVLCPDPGTAAAVKAIDASVRTAVRYGSGADAAVDAWLAEGVHEASVSNVRAAPVPVIVYLDEWRFGHDEEGAIRRAWAAGAEAFLTKAPRAALDIIQDLQAAP